jgi:hypothetical protein
MFLLTPRAGSAGHQRSAQFEVPVTGVLDLHDLPPLLT